ncbi:MAG TPA: FliA/WhiG family RNA polymerase sigma factor [Verrucomicrobiae bacterium]
MNSAAHESDDTPPLLVEARLNHVELWRLYHASGPGDASVDELVRKYLPLVKTVVGRLAANLPSHVDNDELFSAGLVGLLNAVRHYKPDLGASFETYARKRIRGAVLDELRRMDWVPRSVHAKARKIQGVMKELEQKNGTIPTDEEMAAALKVSLTEYYEVLEEIRPATFICLDAPADHEQNEFNEHDLLPDGDGNDPMANTSRAELARLIGERIRQLPDLQRKVIALLYFEDLRVKEIAEASGFCESHICQTHTKAILAIRSYIEQHEAGARRPKDSPA